MLHIAAESPVGKRAKQSAVDLEDDALR